MLDLVDKHHGANAFDRAATLAWTQAQVQLNHLGIDANEAGLLQRLASRLLYADATFGPAQISYGARCPPPALWAQGVSGDLPIMLLRIDDVGDLPSAPGAACSRYWRMKHLAVDLRS